MRISRPELNEDLLMGLVHIGKPVKIRDRMGQSYIEVHNLKSRNPAAWENHICEIRVGNSKARVNVADLIKALQFA